ncbi:hypothetical protein QVD99_007318 [Batrachochytrium dendrobatidis]|nr:hypothetical protein QVD99_007318 [Batrachochytrium dendrobatidis]
MTITADSSYDDIYHSHIESPFIRYQCHCSGQDILQSITKSTSQDGTDSTTADFVQSAPLLPVNGLQVHTLDRLLFCSVCNELKCDGCVSQEVSCCYCPNCMFEVPTTSIKTERGSCGRNCFNCPICGCITTVTNAAAQEGSGTDAQIVGGAYYLSCSTCRWDSTECGLRFERPTGLAAHISKLDSDSPQIKEYDHLLEHYIETMRTFRSSGVGSGDLASSLGSHVFGSLHSSLGLLNSSIRLLRIKPDRRVLAYEPKSKPSTQPVDAVATFLGIPYNERTSLEQRLRQSNGTSIIDINQLRPERVQLRSKRNKRCLKCEHILVKPETKAASTRFGIKMAARDKIPRIQITPPLPLSPIEVGREFTMHLRFVNPLSSSVYIDLETRSAASSLCTVQLHTSNLTLDAYTDPWEIPETVVRSSSTPISINSAAGGHLPMNFEACAVTGPHEQIVVLSVTPLKFESEIHFPIQVNFTTKVESHEAGESTDTSDVSKVTKDPVKQRISFWIVVGVGKSGPHPTVNTENTDHT